MAARVGRRMQDLLHGVMGLIGMGHLQVREGDRKPEEKEEDIVERDGESVKGDGGRWGGGGGGDLGRVRGKEERKSEMSSSVNNMEQAF